jgi:hypothetical protein
MKLVPLALALASFGCGATPRRDEPPEPIPSPATASVCVPPADAAAPTYGELFTRYFAPGTPGHCATAHCHGSVGANEWVCGDTADSCYRGMVKVGLINPQNPTRSAIANPEQSPLTWVNPSGDMPFDDVGPLPEARDAISAWVAACALND